MPCFYTSHPSFWGSQGGSQPGPPGRPLFRRGRGAALPPGGTAPAPAGSSLLLGLFNTFVLLLLLFLFRGPAKPHRGAALRARWGLEAVAGGC